MALRLIDAGVASGTVSGASGRRSSLLYKIDSVARGSGSSRKGTFYSIIHVLLDEYSNTARNHRLGSYVMMGCSKFHDRERADVEPIRRQKLQCMTPSCWNRHAYSYSLRRQ